MHIVGHERCNAIISLTIFSWLVWCACALDVIFVKLPTTTRYWNPQKANKRWSQLKFMAQVIFFFVLCCFDLVVGLVLFKFVYNIICYWIDFICVQQVKSGCWIYKQTNKKYSAAAYCFLYFVSLFMWLQLHSNRSNYNNG